MEMFGVELLRAKVNEVSDCERERRKGATGESWAMHHCTPVHAEGAEGCV